MISRPSRGPVGGVGEEGGDGDEGAPVKGAGPWRGRWLGRLALAPALALILVFFAALGLLFRYGFRQFIPGTLEPGGFTLANFAQIIQPRYLRWIWDTIALSAWTTLAALVLAYPVAYALARARSAALRTTILILTVVPFFTGAIVRAYSWMLVLGNAGFVNAMLIRSGLLAEPHQMLFTGTAVLVGLIHFSMPVMILLLAAAISHIDPNIERSAESLGAGPVQRLLRVTLPLSLPGILSGSVVVFAWTFSAYPTPELLGGGRVKMIANVVADLTLDALNWPGGAAFALFSLGVTFLVLAAVVRLTGVAARGHA